MAILNSDLKPCPFCGAHLNNDKTVLLNTIKLTKNRYAVSCSCGANGSVESTRHMAKKAWNIRNSSHELRSWNPFQVSKKMVHAEFKGNLKSVSLSAILQFCSSEKKTGILQITWKEKKSAICLKGGKIVAASCNWGLQLGQILHDNGRISKKCLQKCLNIAKKSGKPVGEVLLSSGEVGHDALMQAIRFQIREVVMDILFWPEGEFQYRESKVDFDQRVVEAISTVGILLEATVRSDENEALNAA